MFAFFSAMCVLHNNVITGLSQAQLTNINADISSGTLTFSMRFAQLFISGNHMTRGLYNGTPFYGQGTYDITANGKNC